MFQLIVFYICLSVCRVVKGNLCRQCEHCFVLPEKAFILTSCVCCFVCLNASSLLCFRCLYQVQLEQTGTNIRLSLNSIQFLQNRKYISSDVKYHLVFVVKFAFIFKNANELIRIKEKKTNFITFQLRLDQNQNTHSLSELKRDFMHENQNVISSESERDYIRNKTKRDFITRKRDVIENKMLLY